MILKKTKKDDSIHAVYDSSTVLESIFHPKENILEITFKGGTKYRYNEVKDTDYFRFETAESQGSVLNSHIKKYSFSKMDKVDITSLTEEIKTLKKLEKEALIRGRQEILVEAMNNVQEESKGSLYINDEALNYLVTCINEYKTSKL